MTERAPGSALGVDVGGTFTDFVWFHDGVVDTTKVSSTPHDQSVGVIDGAEALEAAPDRLLHGTTVATNALLERRGARTALITSPGFEDIIEIGRQDRPSLYDSFADRPQPLVPAPLRLSFGPTADHSAVLAAMADVEAVAISLLYAYEDDAAERLLEETVSASNPTASVTRSSSVVPEFREYERTATTVLNAFLRPETDRYLSRLIARARSAGLPADIAVMRSSGGLVSIDEARRLPVAILLSGPAGGVVAATALGDALGCNRVISFDMGGTSTDVCWIEDGRPEVTYERSIDGHPCRMPSVAIHTVGAGGGSIGWIDAGGSLRAGPRSAGAEPGPASYDRGGTEPTVTDANVVLGRIGVSLAGGMALRPERAVRALDELGGQIDMDAETVASGITTVIEEVMAGAIRRVSVEEGRDPRDSVLVAFGGAGGLHASSLAKNMGMERAVVPPYAGVFSALGLLLSPPKVDAVVGRQLTEQHRQAFAAAVADTASAALDGLLAASGRQGTVTTFADVRYLGQAHELTVEVPPGDHWPEMASRFHAAHQRRNGFSRRDDPIEVVAVRAEAVGTPALRFDELPDVEPAGPKNVGQRTVVTDGGAVAAQVWRREGLAPGDVVTGPAIVSESEATTYVAPGDRVTVHETGALEIEW